MLFIDDDQKRTRHYIDSLESKGFLVDWEKSLFSAYTNLIENHDKYSLIILDISFVEKYKGETRFAGLEFLKNIRDDLSLSIPILIFTVNVKSQKVIQAAEKYNADILYRFDESHNPQKPSKLVFRVGKLTSTVVQGN